MCECGIYMHLVYWFCTVAVIAEFFFNAIIHIDEVEIFSLNILQKKQTYAKQKQSRGSNKVNFRKDFSTEPTPTYTCGQHVTNNAHYLSD